MAAYHFHNTLRTGILSLVALLFLGGTTMWWQEFYADWASYVLFNYKFDQMPWDEASYVTGANFVVDSGWTIQ